MLVCLEAVQEPELYDLGEPNNVFAAGDFFLARDSINAIARYMLSPVRPSVRPSVRHTGGSVIDG